MRVKYFYKDTGFLSVLYRQIANSFSKVDWGRNSLFTPKFLNKTKKSSSKNISRGNRDCQSPVILFYNGRAGLAALIKMTTLSIDLLTDKKLSVDHIDMKNYPVEFSKHQRWMGKLNAWEYFFHQPKCIFRETHNDKERRISRYVDMRKLIEKHPNGPRSFEFLDDPHEIQRLGRVYKSNIIPNELTSECLSELEDLIQLNSLETLGIYFRGIPHIPNPSHPISFTAEQVLLEARKLTSTAGVKNILISTHDPHGRHVLSRELSGSFRVIPSFRFKENGKIARHLIRKFSLQGGAPLDNLDYLLEMLILSKCRFYLGEIGNVSSVVALASNLSQERLIFSQGAY